MNEVSDKGTTALLSAATPADKQASTMNRRRRGFGTGGGFVWWMSFIIAMPDDITDFCEIKTVQKGQLHATSLQFFKELRYAPTSAGEDRRDRYLQIVMNCFGSSAASTNPAGPSRRAIRNGFK